VCTFLSFPDRQLTPKVRLGLFTALPTKWDLDGNWQIFKRTFLTVVLGKSDLIDNLEVVIYHSIPVRALIVLSMANW
jgi:hypothetical protein